MQQNQYDCGVFMLEYVSQFFKNQQDFLSRIYNNPKEMIDLFESKKVSGNRKNIQAIIKKKLSSI